MSAGDRLTGFRGDAWTGIAGEYYKGTDGEWYGTTPNGLLAGLKNHSVVEHEDGTISVSPSILVSSGEPDAWHGYLERGVWREVA